MKKTGSLVLIYGLLTLVGGLIGHIKTASTASLISGIIFGSLLLASGWGMIQKKGWGQWSALVLAFVLDAFFTYRFAKTLKFFPAGFMSLVSLIMVIVLALRINMANKKRR
jgi:uncharacterized membrane protein (UPF0136 family)